MGRTSPASASGHCSHSRETHAGVTLWPFTVDHAGVEGIERREKM